MKILRRLHLYLGCFFAPLLIFFAVSGIWQCFDLQNGTAERKPAAGVVLLSTLHTGRGLKGEIHGVSTLSSSSVRLFAALMAGALIVNMALGVMMAWRLGHKRGALVATLSGIAVPVALIWQTALR